MKHHYLDLPLDADLFAHLRMMVSAGDPDGPVSVSRDGKPSVLVASLHRGALMAVAQEPSMRFVAWSPHPNGDAPSAHLQRLLDARAKVKASAKEQRA